MLAQCAAVAELRKDHRYATADGSAGGEVGAFGQEQAFVAVGRDPGQQLSAVQGDQGGGAFVAEADAGGAAEFGGFVLEGHVDSWE